MPKELGKVRRAQVLYQGPGAVVDFRTEESPISAIIGGIDDWPEEPNDPSFIYNNELAKLRNEKIGFVFQFHHLLSEFTSLENVLMPVWIGSSKSVKKEETTDLFAALNLSSKMNYYPNQLSGGERSRVALIRGIINKPKILLADEPTGNLDEKNALVLIELLKKINIDFNQSIIITTHNPDVAKLGSSRYDLANGFLKKMR